MLPLLAATNSMSIFMGCLFPSCAPQTNWRQNTSPTVSSVRSERCMSRRMGASASSSSPSQHHQGSDRSSAGPFTYNQNLGLPPGLEPFGPREKKKRITGFATLKKKFIRRRRSSKSCDYSRILRELVFDWSPLDITALLEEYEALGALKDLCVQAELARPPAATFKQDLSALYDYKYNADADLVYRGACFPIHRAILSARCPYFRDLLAGCPGYGARICIELRTATVDVQLFSALLRYLYTGDICPHNADIDINLLRRLREEFGTPNALETDLRYLLETSNHTDATLVFTEGSQDIFFTGPRAGSDIGPEEYGFRPRLELPCHRAILAARSPFFKSLLARRVRNQEERQPVIRIVLDEGVLPQKYARVLLHAIYLDQVDLNLITRNSCGGSGLSEAQAIASTGRTAPRVSPLLEEAMELYQIGRFLELDILAQGSEDLILEILSIDTLPLVLQWARQPYGSSWVYRQALHFLREEFQPIAQSPTLYQLSKEHLMEVLKSPFLQASELEILQAVLKWGEHELIRRMEDREPNVISHTAHSVTRKGVKKKDLNDVELREILADLLPLVRIDHVLPPNSEILSQAIRRGLVSTPPSHMIGGDRENLRINAWIRGGKKNGLFVQPRLFMPYYDELKVLIEDQLVQDTETMLRGRRWHWSGQDIPDTLYMVENRSGSAAKVDILLSSSDVLPVVPDAATLSAMLKREQKLRQSPACHRALAMPLASRSEIGRQIRLRVVREFNLPDNVAETLESYHHRTDVPCIDDEVVSNSATSQRSHSPARRRRMTSTPPRARLLEPPEGGHLPDVAAMAPLPTCSTLDLPPTALPSELRRLDLGDGPPTSLQRTQQQHSVYHRFCLPPSGPSFATAAPAAVPRFL